MSDSSSFYIKTFGCQMNVRDSEIITQTLQGTGYLPAADLDSADIIIVNTCAIRAKAEQKLYSFLGALRRHKSLNPHLKICVAGCVAQQEGAAIIGRMPHVDLVVGTQHPQRLQELLEGGDSPTVAVERDAHYQIPYLRPLPATTESAGRTGKTVAAASRFVTIMQGCDNFCTYCVVPYTRGRETSRPAEDILAEIRAHVDNGTREIVLLGQNVNSYRSTTGSAESFAELLYRVAAIDGLKRLRFTTSNPKDLSTDLIRCFAEIPKLCSHFHLPVQSGSDRILKRMNRRYSVAEYLEKVELLRDARTDLALTTDIIVGFPGEREADFAQSMELLNRVRFHGSFSFKYSDRPNTRAADMLPKIEEAEKTLRLKIFQQRQDRISLERNREYVGRHTTIMVEKVSDRTLFGRTGTNHIVHVEEPGGELRPGDFLEVRIVSAGKHSLQARP